MFAQVLDFDPEDPIALFGMGTALSVLGEWSEAAVTLERANGVDARNSAVYVAWGKALEALDKLGEAQEVYRRGVDVASKRGDLMPLKENGTSFVAPHGHEWLVRLRVNRYHHMR